MSTASKGPAPRPGTLEGEGGARLRTLVWRERGVPACGRLLLVHGLGEHAGRWDETARRLARRGWAVLAFDHRGHGGSAGRRGVLDTVDRLVEDVARARSHAEGVLDGTGPPVVWGHSMGGLAVLRYLQVHAPELPAAVLSAPWLATALEVPSWKRAALPILARIAPELTLSQPVDPALLTRDPEVQAAREADPLVHHRASAGLIRAVESAQGRAREDPVPPGLPILVLLPGDDRVVDAEVTRRWARGVPGGAVEIRELPGVRHEPHQSPEREEIVEGVARWIEERAGHGPPPDQPGQNP